MGRTDDTSGQSCPTSSDRRTIPRDPGFVLRRPAAAPPAGGGRTAAARCRPGPTGIRPAGPRTGPTECRRAGGPTGPRSRTVPAHPPECGPAGRGPAARRAQPAAPQPISPGAFGPEAIQPSAGGTLALPPGSRCALPHWAGGSPRPCGIRWRPSSRRTLRCPRPRGPRGRFHRSPGVHSRHRPLLRHGAVQPADAARSAAARPRADPRRATTRRPGQESAECGDRRGAGSGAGSRGRRDGAEGRRMPRTASYRARPSGLRRSIALLRDHRTAPPSRRPNPAYKAHDQGRRTRTVTTANAHVPTCPVERGEDAGIVAATPGKHLGILFNSSGVAS